MTHVNAGPEVDRKLADYSRLKAEVERLQLENPCDICAGTGKPTSGRPCVCGGTGLASRAFEGMRLESIRQQHCLELADKLANLSVNCYGNRPDDAVPPLEQWKKDMLRQARTYQKAMGST